MTTIHGFADEGFGAVADAFAENFAAGAELGAACAVYQHGRCVVDLHGGVADRRTGRAWDEDTLTIGFSVTKGLMALCASLARQRGLLDLDAAVGTVWPEFAAAGKEDVVIRDLFSHRSGLLALDADLTADDVAAWTPVIRAIEAQKPLWEPGTTFTYHAMTYGWLTGEVLRRVTGLMPGALVAEWLAGPLGADAWIGLPEELEPRVARMEVPSAPGDAGVAELGELLAARPAVVRGMTLGGAFPVLLIDDDHPAGFNSRAAHAMQIPAANGILSARGMAKIYAAAVSDIPSDADVGCVGGPRLLDDASLADAVTVRSEGEPWPGGLMAPGMRFGTGFMVNGIPHRPLLSDSSFGHDGASGSLAFADIDAEVGFGYVNNLVAASGEDRANRLTGALRACLRL